MCEGQPVTGEPEMLDARVVDGRVVICGFANALDMLNHGYLRRQQMLTVLPVMVEHDENRSGHRVMDELLAYQDDMHAMGLRVYALQSVVRLPDIDLCSLLGHDDVKPLRKGVPLTLRQQPQSLRDTLKYAGKRSGRKPAITAKRRRGRV